MAISPMKLAEILQESGGRWDPSPPCGAARLQDDRADVAAALDEPLEGADVVRRRQQRSPSTGPGMPGRHGNLKGGFTPVATPSAQPWKWPVNFTSFGPARRGARSRIGQVRRLRPQHREPHHLRRGTSHVIQSAQSTSRFVARAVVGPQAHLPLTASTIAGWSARGTAPRGPSSSRCTPDRPHPTSGARQARAT